MSVILRRSPPICPCGEKACRGRGHERVFRTGFRFFDGSRPVRPESGSRAAQRQKLLPVSGRLSRCRTPTCRGNSFQIRRKYQRCPAGSYPAVALFRSYRWQPCPELFKRTFRAGFCPEERSLVVEDCVVPRAADVSLPRRKRSRTLVRLDTPTPTLTPGRRRWIHSPVSIIDEAAKLLPPESQTLDGS